MKHSFRSSILLFAVLFGRSSFSAAVPDLAVMSKTPFGRTESAGAVSAITATFNQPMIPLDAPASMGGYCPIQVEPPLKGRRRWQETQVLSFEPSEPLAVATAYAVVIPAGTESKVSHARLSSEVRWSFETQRPQVVASKPKDRALRAHGLLESLRADKCDGCRASHSNCRTISRVFAS
jgi:hypothetical protein